MADAVSAVRAAGSVRLTAHTASASGSKAVTFTDDISATGGRELITTNGGGRATFLLIAGIGYLQGNAAALENYYGVPASAATQLIGRWISFRQGDQGYQQLTSQLRFSYFIDEISLSAPLTRRGSGLVDNQPAVGVHGGASEATSAPSGSFATLYVATTGRPLPISLIDDSKGVRAQLTFSNWGESVKLAPPPNSIPSSSLGSALQDTMNRAGRADAARERDILHTSYQAQLDAARTLADTHRQHAERAETQLQTERAERQHLTQHLTGTPASPPPPDTPQPAQPPAPDTRPAARRKPPQRRPAPARQT
jgi:hypothetical protein